VIPVDAIADPAHKLDHVLYYVMLNTVDLFYVIYVDNNRSNFIWTAPALKSSSDHGLVLSGVNTTTGVWTTATPNPLLTGGGPYLFRNDAGSVLPGGVNPGRLPVGTTSLTEYWVEVVDNKHFKLHTDSMAGAVVIPTDFGHGTISLVKKDGGLSGHRSGEFHPRLSGHPVRRELTRLDDDDDGARDPLQEQ